MDHDEIIAMAKAEGLSFVPEANSPLVRIVQKAVQAEREACAQVCDAWIADHAKADACTYSDCDFVAAATDCAANIRARGAA